MDRSQKNAQRHLPAPVELHHFLIPSAQSELVLMEQLNTQDARSAHAIRIHLQTMDLRPRRFIVDPIHQFSKLNS